MVRVILSYDSYGNPYFQVRNLRNIEHGNEENEDIKNSHERIRVAFEESLNSDTQFAYIEKLSTT